VISHTPIFLLPTWYLFLLIFCFVSISAFHIEGFHQKSGNSSLLVHKANEKKKQLEKIKEESPTKVERIKIKKMNQFGL
jgi:predicted RND superfamily exporter protein